MPRYDYACMPCKNLVEITHSTDAHAVACLCCGRRMERYFSPEGMPMFAEDRSRFAKNPRNGTDFSDMLGQPYPQSRKERDRIYKEKGIEPVSKRDMPSEWKSAMEYSEHVRTGGNRLDPKTVNAPNYNDPSIKSIRQMMDESGFKKGF